MNLDLTMLCGVAVLPRADNESIDPPNKPLPSLGVQSHVICTGFRGLRQRSGFFLFSNAPDSFLPASMEAPGRRIINRRTKHAGDRSNQPRLNVGVPLASIASCDARLTVAREILRRLQHGAGVPEYRSKLRPPSPRQLIPDLKRSFLRSRYFSAPTRNRSNQFLKVKKMSREEYQEYLKSDHWQSLRKRKLSHSKCRCAICGSTDRLEVHHLQYKNIFDVDLTDLRILCNRCHDLFHELKRSGKINLKPGSHHSLFAQTKHYVQLSRGFIRPRKSENPIVQALNRHRTPLGGFKAGVLKSFGVSWPPPKGWTKRLVLLPDGRLHYPSESTQ